MTDNLYDPAAVSGAFDLINRWLQWTTPNVPAERERTVSRATEITQVLANGGVLRRPSDSESDLGLRATILDLRAQVQRLTAELATERDAYNECDAARRRLARALSVETEQHRSLREATTQGAPCSAETYDFEPDCSRNWTGAHRCNGDHSITNMLRPDVVRHLCECGHHWRDQAEDYEPDVLFAEADRAEALAMGEAKDE